MITINHKSKLPLYHQIYETLRKQILRGEKWKPGDMIPPESELVEHYGVSVITIRQALDKLSTQGLIYRQRGRGTFVAHQTLEQSTVRIVSFTQDMLQRGLKPSSRILSSRLVPASTEIAGKLDIAEGTELARLERLRLADNEPMGIETSHLVHRYCPGVLTRHDYASASLSDALERDYGIRNSSAKQVIRAISASPEIAHSLSIPPKSAVLFIERVTYSQDDIPVEFLRIHYRGDRYGLYNDLQG
jgi:GntR family transcriptional regulator